MKPNVKWRYSVWIRLLYIIIFVIVLGELFFNNYSFFRIPTTSMEPTLFPGDRVLVTNFTTGDIVHNDVIVFNRPFLKEPFDSIVFCSDQYLVKRCIALPNDTFEIKGGFFRVHGYEGLLGNMKQQKLVSKGIDTVMYNNNQISVFQAENKFWSVREFGPLWVPAKNMTVVIDSASWIVYKALIEWEQKKKMHLKLNKVYLGDSLINAYCFMEDYYFVAGDNLPVSVDSRYWGVLPRSFIVGKVAFVWFTRRKETKNIEWKRMFLKM